MQEKLRATSSLLRDDLLQAHFDSAQKLSTISTIAPGRPVGGYFYIRHWASVSEGVDGLNVPSLRMNANAAQTPVLCFTVRRQGTLPEDYFTARIPTTGAPLSATERLLFGQGPADYHLPPPNDSVLISREAEIGYFLVATGDTAAGTTPLYSLRRRVRVVVPDSPPVSGSLNVGAGRVPATLWASRYAEVSCMPDYVGNQPTFLHFNRFADLTNPDRQVMSQPRPRSLTVVAGRPQPLVQLGTGGQGDPTWFGDDLVLTDVISFNVRILRPGAADFVDLNSVYNTGVTPGTRINALEITIRVWDVKTQLTRQMTIVQDM
jgi:hypothetical protein